MFCTCVEGEWVWWRERYVLETEEWVRVWVWVCLTGERSELQRQGRER